NSQYQRPKTITFVSQIAPPVSNRDVALWIPSPRTRWTIKGPPDTAFDRVMTAMSDRRAIRSTRVRRLKRADLATNTPSRRGVGRPGGHPRGGLGRRGGGASVSP